MELKRFVIYPIATSCAGKSTLTKALSEKLPDIYTVSYDKLKWQLAGYHRDKHRSLIKEITFGLFEVICSKYIPILLDVSLQDEAEYFYCYKIAQKYGYKFIPIKLIAPTVILLQRFRERIADAKQKGTEISVTDESIFLENLFKKSFVPLGTPIFDTSEIRPEYIANEIIVNLIC
ncbi:MAG: hypothetical protein A3I89_00570 [Candidatus Harrisonbacteria bacterium RIFCSPLOWO2_02_FULL_41_11]|uniref:Uncharacterized protein n=1 Tax=Candidatus Harrisonbacteria bacterium RIFCSPHIGHO2_02_FULL_42_16 TaxID=1798404 RepID=A0A1G1ZH65_9BACT|nr:MAG: hypothetical protein A3B92_02375 [Candidatus Harrisonbacteria bacterium RIFCSPHIGHO2_02_FULL_42_16]OGY66490.1 MAG: hypothetical protein A3I89_00570 [Candidatus Harrisonbacteria bacterium RIFCSPLOWO2_02_FULL_41_11]